MKNLKIILIALTCLVTHKMYSFQFANTLKQRVMQYAGWQRAVQFGATHASKVKKIASLADKAIPAGLATYIITSNRNNLELEPLSNITTHETFAMTENLCKKLNMNFSDIQLYKATKTGSFQGTSAGAKSSIFGKNKIIIFDEFFKRPSSQQEAILGHELIHLKNRDTLTQTALFIGIAGGAIGSFRFAHYILKNVYQSNAAMDFLLSPLKSISLPLMAAFNPLCKGTNVHYDYDENGKMCKMTINDGGKSAGFGLRLSAAYARFCEKRADIDSAKLAGTAQGNIDALQEHVSEYGSYTAILDQHPCPQERIKYLEPYAQQKKAS